jgi:hypothetical protein
MHTAKREERGTHIRSDDYCAKNDELVKRLGSALDKLNERVERRGYGW